MPYINEEYIYIYILHFPIHQFIVQSFFRFYLLVAINLKPQNCKMCMY